MATYRDAGVDLEAADRLVTDIAGPVTATWGDRVVGGFGGFAAGIRLPAGHQDPVLMMSTDGVGTKGAVAARAGMVDGLGWDLVAMCVDDLVAAGARPLGLTDYIAIGRLDQDLVRRLVVSIAEACSEAGVALLGGETAEHPGVMEPGEFDLAAAAVGVVEAGAEVDGSAIAENDVVVGVASPNLRSNGFSLVRSAVLSRVDLDDEMVGTGRSVAAAVLEPSVIYTPAILDVLEAEEVHGMAHVTGGGIAGNIVRVLPAGLRAVIDTTAWPRPPVFDAVASIGSIAPGEMYRTFNMGIGFALITAPAATAGAIEALSRRGHDSWVIGEISSGDRAVTLT